MSTTIPEGPIFCSVSGKNQADCGVCVLLISIGVVMCIEKEESAEAMEQPIPNSGLRHRISTILHGFVIGIVI